MQGHVNKLSIYPRCHDKLSKRKKKYENNKKRNQQEILKVCDKCL